MAYDNVQWWCVTLAVPMNLTVPATDWRQATFEVKAGDTAAAVTEAVRAINATGEKYSSIRVVSVERIKLTEAP